jgi:glycerophosphoryl diester phosphodiesterase
VSRLSQELVCRRVCSQSVSKLRVAVVRSEKLVAEAGDSLGTQRRRNAHHWKPLPSSTMKTFTENISLVRDGDL